MSDAERNVTSQAKKQGKENEKQIKNKKHKKKKRNFRIK